MGEGERKKYIYEGRRNRREGEEEGAGWVSGHGTSGSRESDIGTPGIGTGYPRVSGVGHRDLRVSGQEYRDSRDSHFAVPISGLHPSDSRDRDLTSKVNEIN